MKILGGRKYLVSVVEEEFFWFYEEKRNKEVNRGKCLEKKIFGSQRRRRMEKEKEKNVWREKIGKVKL